MSNNMCTSKPNQVEELSSARKRFHGRAVSYEEEKAAEPDSKHARHDRNINAHENVVLKDLIKTNDELRHHVQILDSIPDIVVVFDLNGNIKFTNSEAIAASSFWEMTTPDSKAFIQTAITNALVEESQDDGSWPLFNGRSVSCKFVRQTRSVSLKGNVFLNEENVECIMTMRPMTTDVHANNVVSDASVGTQE